jgi:hypothetical protein
MVNRKLLTEIEEVGFAHIVGMRMPKVKAMAEVLNRPGRYQKVKENLKEKEVIYQNAHYIVCFNPQEAKKTGFPERKCLLP